MQRTAVRRQPWRGFVAARFVLQHASDALEEHLGLLKHAAPQQALDDPQCCRHCLEPAVPVAARDAATRLQRRPQVPDGQRVVLGVLVQQCARCNVCTAPECLG